ncbi:MurR/RpiR family transcriptional regulator [Shinella granuli]|uniref:MurR/RpiR family transcriptional regulator n=1 Tax=Shinella granuli TaxID=323621 RepID=UPI0010554703
MPTIQKLKEQIARGEHSFGVEQQRALSLLFDHPDVAAFGRLPSVANRCGVSQTTIVHLAKKAGFLGFKEMRAAFQRHLLERSSYRSPPRIG